MLKGQDFNTTIYGLFSNYLNCNNILGYNNSIASIADQLAKNCVLLEHGNAQQDYSFFKYMSICCIDASFNFTQDGQNWAPQLPNKVGNFYFSQLECTKVFD